MMIFIILIFLKFSCQHLVQEKNINSHYFVNFKSTLCNICEIAFFKIHAYKDLELKKKHFNGR